VTRRRPADDLFEPVTAFANLHSAALRSVRGKRERLEPAAFMAGLERNLLRLQDELRAGTWRPGVFRSLIIHEPKPRCISVAPFADRVVHQALCARIGPVLERGWSPSSFASRLGYGTHRAIERFEALRERHRWVLRADVFRYFPSIDHAILKALLRRRIGCARTLALLDVIIDGSNPQEPVHRYFDGDDLWTPFERARGLPLGNLTSQLLGNHYLDALDHWLAEVAGAPHFVRYLDDIAVFGDDADELRALQQRMAAHLEGRRLLLHPHKTQVRRSDEAQVFLGFELRPGGWRRLTPEHLGRAQRRIDQWRKAWHRGAADEAAVRASVGGWVAHARHADTWRLRCSFFPHGWFAPGEEPARLRTPGARRRLEQQPDERPLRQPQPRRADESQQQHRFPSCP
jgi:retron-type reverse transcriptase